MIEVRRATGSDAPELLRLRGVMLSAMSGAPVPSGPWQAQVRDALRSGLDADDPVMAGIVADRPEEPGRLAACALGAIERRLGNPSNPRGEFGYVLNVVTDEAYRRRGLSRACVRALLAWFAGRGVPVVDLRATRDGAPLYAELGFAASDEWMRARVTGSG